MSKKKQYFCIQCFGEGYIKDPIYLTQKKCKVCKGKGFYIRKIIEEK